jgi:hypothetical protein
MNAILIEEGFPILNIKAKDKLEFNSMMVKFYDGDDIIPSIEYLTEYYVLQNSRLI